MVVVSSITLGSFLFSDPVRSPCYFDHETSIASEDPEPLAGHGEVTDVTSIWHDWFLYNEIAIAVSAFLAIAFTVYGACLAIVSDRTRFRSTDVLGYLLIVVITCATIVSILWGIIIRYDKPGRSCAYNILFRSGRFMLVWLITQGVYLLWVCFLIGK